MLRRQSEQLAGHDPHLSPDTLRATLKGAGLWEPRRRRGKHRAGRERWACLGHLAQMDGSASTGSRAAAGGAC